MNSPTPDLPDADPADVVDQQLSLTGTEAAAEPPSRDPEAPEADVVEQARAAGPAEHRVARELPLEADPIDAAEQAVVLPVDDDEFR